MIEVDWQAAEDLLVRDGVTQFPEIAAKHPDEDFYGVFFDCDIVYTCAQAHMNTTAKLREYAQRCKNDDLTREEPLGRGSLWYFLCFCASPAVASKRVLRFDMRSA